MMKKNVLRIFIWAVLASGCSSRSSEFDISLYSASDIYRFIDVVVYNPEMGEPKWLGPGGDTKNRPFNISFGSIGFGGLASVSAYGTIPAKLAVTFCADARARSGWGGKSINESMRKNNRRTVVCDVPVEAQSPKFWEENRRAVLWVKLISPDKVDIFLTKAEWHPEKDDEDVLAIKKHPRGLPDPPPDELQQTIDRDTMIMNQLFARKDSTDIYAMVNSGGEGMFFKSLLFPAITASGNPDFAINPGNYYAAFTGEDRLCWIGNPKKKAQIEGLVNADENSDQAAKKMLLAGYLNRHHPEKIMSFYNNIDAELLKYFSISVTVDQLFDVMAYEFSVWKKFEYHRREEYPRYVIVECNPQLLALLTNLTFAAKRSDPAKWMEVNRDIMKQIANDDEALVVWAAYWNLDMRALCDLQVLQNLDELYPRIKEVHPNHIYALEAALKHIDTMRVTDNVKKMKAIGAKLLRNMQNMPLSSEDHRKRI